MAKLKPSLEAFTHAAPEPASEPQQPGAPAERIARPHVSVYLDKSVQRVIKQIALEYDRKPHDLYVEGLNLMLRQYGKPTVGEITNGAK